jgi:hypothetical protein
LRFSLPCGVGSKKPRKDGTKRTGTRSGIGAGLALAGLAALIAIVLAGSAFARSPDRPVPVGSLRAIVDHYRTVTWTYERAAGEHRTPTAYSDRRSTDRGYLQWSIDTWTKRSYRARARALNRIHRRLRVTLPAAPTLHGQLSDRVAYSRRLTLRLRKLYPGHVSRSFASARAGSGSATLRLWQARSAVAALAVSEHGVARPEIPTGLLNDFMCIHHFEGAWTSNTGNGYYGGLQMDVSFQTRYASDFMSRWGTADNWPAWAQVEAAVRAFQSGRGFAPWPNTARFCGLL